MGVTVTKRAAVFAVSALVVALAAALWWLDFKAVRSESSAQSTTTTVQFGQGGEPARPQDGVAIYVAPGSDFARGLSDGLARYAAASPAIGSVEVLATRQEEVRRPILAVEAEEMDTTWTPFYARARVVVSAAYASDGDLSWWHEPVVQTSNKGPGIWTKIRAEMSDTTWGLISRPGYARQLGEQAAVEVIKQLEAAPASKSARGAEAEGSN
jgi:hypothetical protein